MRLACFKDWVRMRLRSQRGFSFFELLVVLIIVGVMSAVVIPTIGRGLSGLKLRTEAKKFSAALRYGRNLAVTWGGDVEVALNKSSGTVVVRLIAGAEEAPLYEEELLEEGEEAEEGEGEPLRPEQPREVSYTLPEGVTFKELTVGREEVSEEGGILDFFSNGGSTGGRIILADDKEREIGIEVDFLTGRVRIVAEEEA
jgi:prepilin-type N-terminal cleavage/methylation domain-containing protein